MRAPALLLLALAIAGCVNQPTRLRPIDHTYNLSSAGNDPAYSRLAAFFDEAAFGRDDVLLRRDVRDYERVITRWERPMRVTIGGTASKEVERKIRSKLDRFRDLTGVRVVWEGRDAKRYNVKVVLVSSENIRARASYDTACFAKPDDANGSIVSAVIFVPYDRADTLDNCLDHELIHAFGLAGHSHRLNSALSYMHNTGNLTAWDEIMLRILYSPQLRAGMHRSEAWPVVGRLLSQELNRLMDASAPLPELGEEYWGVFADEIPFRFQVEGLRDLPHLALASHGRDGLTEVRAVFSGTGGDPRTEVTLASGEDLDERWQVLTEHWQTLIRGSTDPIRPQSLTRPGFTALWHIQKTFGRDCLLFAREAGDNARYFTGYFCRRGAVGDVGSLLDSLTLEDTPEAGS